MRKSPVVIEVKGKDRFLRDIAEETNAAEKLNEKIKVTCDNLERLSKLIDAYRTAQALRALRPEGMAHARRAQRAAPRRALQQGAAPGAGARRADRVRAALPGFGFYRNLRAQRFIRITRGASA